VFRVSTLVGIDFGYPHSCLFADELDTYNSTAHLSAYHQAPLDLLVGDKQEFISSWIIRRLFPRRKVPMADEIDYCLSYITHFLKQNVSISSILAFGATFCYTLRNVFSGQLHLRMMKYVLCGISIRSSQKTLLKSIYLIKKLYTFRKSLQNQQLSEAARPVADGGQNKSG
jgi:hypothetical protein